jgi:hypothetical protein
MPSHRKNLNLTKSKQRNQHRDSLSFVDQMRVANKKAHQIANQPTNLRSQRTIKAALAEESYHDYERLDFFTRFIRWIIAIALLPLCGITSLTLASQFSTVTIDQKFWASSEFWFFSIGAIMMVGWFITGLFHNFFLYFYVLGHEITHAVFVYLHLGWVSEFKVTTKGGYVTTNKSNFIISLAPYFVPFWSSILLILYPICELCFTMPSYSEKILFYLVGFSWSFHLLWTLWMIPRDQPDLKENGTFFSVIIIYLANVVVLSIMLCIGAKSITWHDFIASWQIYAQEFSNFTWQYLQQFL